MSEHDDIRELAQAGFKQARLDLINLRMENRELRAELAASHQCHECEALETDYRNAEAAIARVRAICADGRIDERAVLNVRAAVLRALDSAE